MSSDATYTLADTSDITKTKVSIVSTSPINFKNIWVRVKGPYLQTTSQVLEIKIYVCGFETINANTAVTTLTATYDLNSGTQTLTHPYDTTTTNLESSQPLCPIIGYKLLDSSKADYTGSQFTSKPKAIDVDTSTVFD